MPEVLRYPSLDTAVSGTWTLPGNVQADDGNLASTTIAAKNTTVIREQGNYGFDGLIPADAVSIDSVVLEVEHHLTANVSISTFGVRARITTTDLARQDDTAEPTTPTARTYDITALRAWVRADLLDGTFKTRIEAVQGNNASSCTYNWDYVRVRVNYTAAGGGGGAKFVIWMQDD